MTTHVEDEDIVRKEALRMDFKTALASTLTTMGLEQLKPKQVREYLAFYKSLFSGVSFTDQPGCALPPCEGWIRHCPYYIDVSVYFVCML